MIAPPNNMKTLAMILYLDNLEIPHTPCALVHPPAILDPNPTRRPARIKAKTSLEYAIVELKKTIVVLPNVIPPEKHNFKIVGAKIIPTKKLNCQFIYGPLLTSNLELIIPLTPTTLPVNQ